MSVDRLTTSQDAMVAALITGLAGHGFTFTSTTQSFAEFLAATLTSVGTPATALTMGIPDLLAGLATFYVGTPYSSLTTDVPGLLAAIVNAL